MTAREFELLVTRLRPKLHKIAFDFFHEKEEAEDVVQEVFLRMWQREWQPDDNVEALAVKATKNLCVSIARKKKVRQAKTLDGLEIECPSGEADTEILLEEHRQRLENAIRQLPPSEQRLIRFKQQAEVDAQQISAITQIPVNSVRVMLSSARRKLLKLLQP